VGQTYKLLLAPATDTDPPASPIWTIDNVSPINDTTQSIDQWVAGPTPTFISATSFSLVGDQTANFHVGRRLKTTNTSGTVYSAITNAVFGALTTVTVVNDSGSLDSGLSAVSYGLLAASNPAVPALLNNGNITQALADAATTSWNTSLGAVATWTMAGSRTLSAPSPLRVGQRYVLVVTQDATGGRAVTWNAAFIGVKGAAMPQPNKKAGAVTTFAFVSPDGANLYLVGPATAGPLSVVVYTASGTDTIPSGATRARVYVKAAGASGGGSNSVGRNGGGGGEGEERWGWVSVTPGATSTVTLNNGGTAIALNTNSTGNSGGTSVWTDGTTTITATGGIGGIAGAGGGAGGNGGSAGSGGDYGMPGNGGLDGADATAGTVGMSGRGGGKGGGTQSGAGVANSGGGGGGGTTAVASGAGAKGTVVIEYWN
jgi:hypothetical protein